jgi:hypothetical protein
MTPAFPPTGGGQMALHPISKMTELSLFFSKSLFFGIITGLLTTPCRSGETPQWPTTLQ